MSREQPFVALNPVPHTGFLQTFEATVHTFPDAIAVISGDAAITYATLNARANQLGRYLQKRGIRPETIVVLYMDRSIDLIVALLGTLKAGGAYLPVDPHFTPPSRLSWILNTAQPAVILTESDCSGNFGEPSWPILLWKNVDSASRNECQTDFPHSAIPDNLAYIMFTSGSTGRPKGIMISHTNLHQCAAAMQEPIQITPSDRYLHTASFAFSSSVRQLTVPLSCGAAVVIAPTPVLRDPDRLFLLVQQTQVTIIDLIPSFWRSCLESLSDREPCFFTISRNSLRVMLFASEVLPINWLPHWNGADTNPIHLVNMYGQTETTGIVLTCHLPDRPGGEGDGLAPVGTPVAATRVSLLSPQGHPVAVGTPGEIHIAGPGVARGYWNAPDMTAEKFIPNHFPGQPGARLYRTGDNGRMALDGLTHFLGRQDLQVKIRGHRVELGEIDRTLFRHPDVLQGLTVKTSPDGAETILHAYVVPRSGSGLSKTELFNYLRRHLPFYMIPMDISLLSAFPLSVSGKIDRQALTKASLPQEDVSPSDSAAPSLWETRLCDIWKEVLGLNHLHIQDNFFNIGGHSLKAIQIMNKIRKSYGLSLPIQSIFDHPTVAELAQKVEEGSFYA